MAVTAGNGQVSSHEGEASFLVRGNGKGRGAEVFHSMTGLTAILMRQCCELSLVTILMAIEASSVFGMVVCVTTHGQVALLTRHAAVLSGQRIRGLAMARRGECRGSEARLGMARGAVAPIGTRAKLPLVRVGVAVQAPAMTDGRLEIGGLVAFRTGNCFVLSLKGKTRSLMIEIGSQSRLTPAGCGMTTPTSGHECSLVRVGVARRAV